MPEISGILLGLVICIIIYLPLFESIFGKPLESFPDRAIGITVLSGIDANVRTLLYCVNLFFITLLLLGLVGFFSWINREVKTKISVLYIQVELSIQTYLTLFALFLTLYSIFKNETFYQPIVITLISMVGLLYLMIGWKIYLYQKLSSIFHYYKDYSNLTFSIMLAFALFFVGWSILDDSLSFSGRHLALFLITSFFVYVFNPIFLDKIGIGFTKARSAYLMASIAFSLIPAVVPLSNELHYSILWLQTISAVHFAKLLVMILFLTGLFLFVIYSFRDRKSYTSFISERLIFPAILAGFFLFSNINGQIIFPNFDMFHNGERMIITQQMFSFGKIPFIDILPTHGIMDFIGDSLYSIINGYRGPEMFLWRWIPALAGILLWYFLLARIVSPVFAFFLVFLTPEAFLFSDVYRIILIIALILPWVFKNPGLKRSLTLWISLVFLFFWRFDFGIIASLSTMGIIPFIPYLQSRKKVFTSGSLFRFYMPLLMAGTIVIGLTLFLYGLIFLLSGYNPLEVFQQILLYFKIQAPTQSLALAYEKKTVFFLLEYIISPFVSVIYIVVFVFRFKSDQNSNLRTVRLILVWIAIFSLIMTVRTVQRHTLIALFNPVLSMFLLSAIPFFFSWRNPWIPRMIFLLTFLVFAIFLNNIPRRGMVKAHAYSLAHKDELYSFFSFPNKGSRVKIEDSTQIKKFSTFCDQFLSDNQTFFDFSNAPMLYVMANRPFPGLIIPNLYHAADLIQKDVINRLEMLRIENQLPYVVFKQNNKWDSIDGVPQPIRSYRIAEYIYMHYLPFVRVDNYEIWKERNWIAQITPLKSTFPIFGIPSGIKTDGITITKSSKDSLKLKTMGRAGNISEFLYNWNGFIYDSSVNNILKFRFSCSRAGVVKVYFATDSNDYSRNKPKEINISTVGNIIESRILINGFKHNTKITDILVEFPGDAEIIMYRPLFTSSDFLEIKRTMPQKFDLMYLPYIWGNFDKNDASKKTEIVLEHVPDNSVIKASSLLKIPISKEIDKSQGNYLQITASASQVGNIKIFYGKENPSEILFYLRPSGKPEQYMVRISSQWSWINDRISFLSIRPSTDVTIQKVIIRKGD